MRCVVVLRNHQLWGAAHSTEVNDHLIQCALVRKLATAFGAPETVLCIEMLGGR